MATSPGAAGRRTPASRQALLDQATPSRRSRRRDLPNRRLPDPVHISSIENIHVERNQADWLKIRRRAEEGGEVMTIPPHKYEVGYGQPPKSTRWKKGQCGNPNRIRKRAPKRAVEMIDEFFAAEIDIVENGISRRVPNFEAIVFQLWGKAVTSTNKRAVNRFAK